MHDEAMRRFFERALRATPRALPPTTFSFHCANPALCGSRGGVAILQPLLEELLVLEAVKAACQQRNVVRGEWAKAVKAHEAKKAVLHLRKEPGL